MASSVDLVVRILGDTSHASSAFGALGANISKVLGMGSAGAVVPAIVKVSEDYQTAMAKIQQAFNSTDFAPGTQRYIDAHTTIERMSTTMASSFEDVAASMAQAAKITDQYGTKLPTAKVDEFVDANLRLKASSQDSMDAISSGQSMAMLDKMFSSTDYKGTASMVAALSTQHPQDEESLWQAALGIGRIGAPLGVTMPQALGLGNYLSDVGGGGMTGGASIGRMLLRMDTSADQVLDPVSKYADVKKNRDAQEKLDDLQTSLKEAELKRSEMYGQHGLKTAYKKNPEAVMAEDDRIAKLHREIADQQENIAHENDPNRSRPRGTMNVAEMAKTAGQTADAFAELFKENPVDALLDYTAGLHDLGKEARGAAMTKAGIVNTKDQTTISLLSDQPESVRRMILMAEQQQENPTAIDQISNIGLSTTAAKQTDVSSMVTNANAALGEPMRQGLDAVYDQLLKLGKAAEDDASGLVNFGGGMTSVLTVMAPFLPGAVGKVFGKGGPATPGGPATQSAAPTATPVAGGIGAALLPAAIAAGSAVALIAQGQSQLDQIAALDKIETAMSPERQAEMDRRTQSIIEGTNKQTGGLYGSSDSVLIAARQQAMHDMDGGSSGAPAPAQITIGDLHINAGNSLEEILAAVTGRITAAWNAAGKGTPVAGAMGGNYSTNNLTPR